jgi:hypothetical protein
VYVQVAGLPKIYAIADEDMKRENEKETSAVHFLRLEFDSAARAGLRSGAPAAVGIDHPNYSERIGALRPEVVASLLRDFA